MPGISLWGLGRHLLLACGWVRHTCEQCNRMCVCVCPRANLFLIGFISGTLQNKILMTINKVCKGPVWKFPPLRFTFTLQQHLPLSGALFSSLTRDPGRGARAVTASAASRLSLAVLRAARRSPAWLRPYESRVYLRGVACDVLYRPRPLARVRVPRPVL